MSSSELGCVYASLILADDGIEITAEKISQLLKAADVEFEPFWPGLFAKALAGKDVLDMVSNIGSASGPVVASAPVAASQAQADTKAEEKAPEPEEESEEDMDGFSLFD
eukprot:m.155941 g.155941  ORF g.155941 m.155941 type:complete len:109 (+) comp16286_c3_seq8:305-631(+)